MTQPWMANPNNNYATITNSHGKLQSNGTVTPSPVVDDTRLNPYTGDDWGSVIIAGLVLPGIVLEITGASKPEEWNIQKGTSASNATTVWKGTKLAEEIKITLALHDAESFDAYYDVRATLRPKLGSKPPSLLITNPIINFAGVFLISCKDVMPPKWSARGNYWTGDVIVVEYNPSKKANAGPANPAQKKPNEPTANDALDQELKDTFDQAKKL